LRAIRPSVVQQWVAAASRTLAPSYVRLLLATLSAILGAAVEDGIIARNPCASRAVRAPSRVERTVEAWTPATVAAVEAAMPARYAALVPVGVGVGLRHGEALGLSVDNIDFLRREVHVRHQLKHVNGGTVFDLPKRGKVRTVPLSETIAVALAEHLRRFPPVEVTLPWREPGGAPTTLELVFANTAGGPVNRGSFNDRVWKPALTAAGVEPTRENGYHVLRHTYASTQLQAGVSVPAVAKYLGHADGGALLLRTYAHVMPQAPDHARAAVDAFLRSCEPGVSHQAGS
jgi:integrase